MLRRLAICSAFATLAFLTTWAEGSHPDHLYYRHFSPLTTVVLPVLILQLILTAAMWGSWTLAGRAGWLDSSAAHGLFLASCIWPLGVAVTAMLSLAPLRWGLFVQGRTFWYFGTPVALAGLVIALLRIRRTSWLAREALLYSWPVLLIFYYANLRATLAHPAAAFADGPLAQALPASQGHARLLWIIFDELDQRVAFSERPPRIALPELDRLRAESFYADAATSPADATIRSIPALLSGRHVESAKQTGPSELALQWESGGATTVWSREPNVFDDARALGHNTALVGWYHPYGRILNRSLTRSIWISEWMNAGGEEPYRPESLAQLMADRLRFAAAAYPLLGRLPAFQIEPIRRSQKIAQFEELMQAVRSIAADPSIGLALLHLPIPHAPGIYDPSQKALTNSPASNYLDNLLLADRTLGEIRQTMEAAGEWDRTTVLVTSDHGWRRNMWSAFPTWTAEEANLPGDPYPHEVPFLLKFPGQTASVEYHPAWDTVISRSLVNAILRGEVTTPRQTAEWLREHASVP